MDQIEKSALSIADLAYAAALGSGAWDDVVAQILGIIGGGSVSLDAHARSPGQVTCEVLVGCGLDETAVRTYVQHFAKLNLIVENIATAKPGVIAHIGELIDRSVFEKSVFANEFIAPNGLGETGGILLENEERFSSALTVWFPKDMRDHSRFAPLFRLLEPHLRRAVKANRLLGIAQASATSLAATVDGSGKAICIVDRIGRLVHATPAASRILGTGDGLTVRNGALHARTPAIQDALMAAIRLATDRSVQASEPATVGDPGLVVVPRRSGQQPLRLMIVPVPHSGASGLFAGERHAMVAIRDPERRQRTPSATALGRWFGLTPAEAQLAVALIAGKSLTEHAADRGVSPETTRTQLKTMMVKLDCGRQSELVALLIDQGPPFGFDDAG